MPSRYERALGAELVVVLGVETADALLASAGQSAFSLPDPSVYFASLVVFIMLSGAAMFGEKAGRLAAAFGGVATLAILMAPTARSKAAGKPQPLIMSLITYFDSIISTGTQAAPVTNEPTQPGSNVPQGPLGIGTPTAPNTASPWATGPAPGGVTPSWVPSWPGTAVGGGPNAPGGQPNPLPAQNF